MAAITPDGGAAAVGDDASDSISLPSGPTPSTGEEARSRIAEFAQTVSTYRSHIATVKASYMQTGGGGHGSGGAPPSPIPLPRWTPAADPAGRTPASGGQQQQQAEELPLSPLLGLLAAAPAAASGTHGNSGGSSSRVSAGGGAGSAGAAEAGLTSGAGVSRGAANSFSFAAAGGGAAELTASPQMPWVAGRSQQRLGGLSLRTVTLAGQAQLQGQPRQSREDGGRPAPSRSAGSGQLGTAGAGADSSAAEARLRKPRARAPPCRLPPRRKAQEPPAADLDASTPSDMGSGASSSGSATRQSTGSIWSAGASSAAPASPASSGQRVVHVRRRRAHVARKPPHLDARDWEEEEEEGVAEPLEGESERAWLQRQCAVLPAGQAPRATALLCLPDGRSVQLPWPVLIRLLKEKHWLNTSSCKLVGEAGNEPRVLKLAPGDSAELYSGQEVRVSGQHADNREHVLAAARVGLQGQHPLMTKCIWDTGLWPGINPPPGRSGGRYTGPLSLVNGRLARVRSVAIVGTQVQGADGQVEAVAQVARWPRAGHSAVVAALRLAALRSVRARRAFRDALALLCQMHALSSAALRSVALELVERLLGAQERQRLEESLEAGEGPGVDLGPLQEGEEQLKHMLAFDVFTAVFYGSDEQGQPCAVQRTLRMHVPRPSPAAAEELSRRSAAKPTTRTLGLAAQSKFGQHAVLRWGPLSLAPQDCAAEPAWSHTDPDGTAGERKACWA